MKTSAFKLCAACAVAALALAAAAPLSACSANNAQSSDSQPAAKANAGFTTSASARTEIEKAFDSAPAFATVSFETACTTTVSDGNQTGSARIEKKGQLEHGEEGARVHYDYTLNAGSEAETRYEMFANATDAFVRQDGVLYGGVEGASPAGYLADTNDIFSKAAFKELLDASYGYNISTQEDGSTVVKVHAEAEKLRKSRLIDKTSLPKEVSLGQVQVEYAFDADGRLVSVKFEADTPRASAVATGKLPASYHIEQMTAFSGYDETEMPEWPTTADLASQNLEIQTDESGRQYIVADDGNTYYVDSIDEDGTVRLSAQ